jgi:hypothetical protein
MLWSMNGLPDVTRGVRNFGKRKRCRLHDFAHLSLGLSIK